MLFDLQSRRRRTAVKFIYLLLAILMAGGLILFGVGTGSGNGGFLNSLSGNSSSGNSVQNTAVQKQLKAAEKKVAAQPDSPAAWQALMEAQYEVAGTGSDYDSSTSTFTAAGKAELGKVLASWDKYTALVKGTPNESSALLAGRVSVITGDYKASTVAWQDYIESEPTAANGYTCLALTGYAAKNKTLAAEAATKAVALTPKLSRLELKEEFTEVKSSASTAKTAAQSDC